MVTSTIFLSIFSTKEVFLGKKQGDARDSMEDAISRYSMATLCPNRRRFTVSSDPNQRRLIICNQAVRAKPKEGAAMLDYESALHNDSSYLPSQFQNVRF